MQYPPTCLISLVEQSFKPMINVSLKHRDVLFESSVKVKRDKSKRMIYSRFSLNLNTIFLHYVNYIIVLMISFVVFNTLFIMRHLIH